MNLFTKSKRPVLEPQADLPWASGAVFNPAAWYDGRTVHLLFRAVPKGYTRVGLERAADGEPETGFADYISSVGYASSRDAVHFDVRPEPFLLPDSEFDRFGVEDPRIAYLGGRFYVTYTALASEAFSPDAAVRIALASTEDFVRVEKHGVIGPPERDKDAVIFPAFIDGRVAMLHRILPNIQLITFEDVEQLCRPQHALWEKHISELHRHVIMRPQESWEEMKIGAGPTPIRTEEGWLLIYHGVDRRYVYRAGLALLDLDDPSRVIARTAHPVLEPESEFERAGDVNNVVFPEGAAVIDGTLHLYYGAADRVIGHASAPLTDVLQAVLSSSFAR